MSNEFPQPTFEQKYEGEPTVEEVVDFAWKDGFIDTEERNDMFDDDMETVLGNLYGIILDKEGDPDEAFARWGIVAEAEES